MSIVSNTGPLIALAKADLLPLLKILFDHVDIPEAVRDEILAKPTTDAQHIAIAIQSGLIRAHIVAPALAELPVHHSVGPGELQAIVLAKQRSLTLLIDDRAARRLAIAHGVVVTGTIGVLVEAKRAGEVTSVRRTLHEIRARGYWFSDALIEAATKLAEE